MTDTVKKALAALSIQKVVACRGKSAEAIASGNYEEASATVTDYLLYFKGAKEALEAAGVAASDSDSIGKAASALEADEALFRSASA